MPKIQSLQSDSASAARCRGLSPDQLRWSNGWFQVMANHLSKVNPKCKPPTFFPLFKTEKKINSELLAAVCFFAKAILVRDTGVAHICLDGTTLSLHLESSTRFCIFEPIADGVATSWFGETRYLGKSWNVVETCPNEPQFS